MHGEECTGENSMYRETEKHTAASAVTKMPLLKLKNNELDFYQINSLKQNMLRHRQPEIKNWH